MPRTDILCLCQQYDLKGNFGKGFESEGNFRLVTRDQINDPADVEFVLAFKPAPDAFDELTNLKLVCSVGAGVDGLLTHPGLRKDLTVVRMMNPEQAEMMAGFAAWFVVDHHRGMSDFAGFQAKKNWAAGHCNAIPSQYPVSVLGYGEMGQAIGKALTAMGYPVMGWANKDRQVDGVTVLSGDHGLEEVLGSARAVICVLPLTDGTYHILNAKTLGMMREDSILVQLGRGGHLDEAALINALNNGRPGLAALDVFATEPLPEDSPLWTHPKVRITPHIASDSGPSAIAASVSRAIRAFLAGEAIPGAVDRVKGY